MELHYYHMKMNVQVVSGVAKQQKLGQKSVKCLEMMVSTQPTTLKANFEKKSETSHRKKNFT